MRSAKPNSSDLFGPPPTRKPEQPRYVTESTPWFWVILALIVLGLIAVGLYLSLVSDLHWYA